MNSNVSGGTAGAIYCLGFIGAAVFYIGHAANLGLGVLGLLKAIIWPACLVYDSLQFLVK